MTKRRNIYKLEDLTPKKSVNETKRLELFETTELLLKFDFSDLDSPWDLILKNPKIKEYYVLFDYIVYKGKQKFFKGEVALVDNETLAAFVKKSILNNENRPLRIIPVESNDQFLIYIDDSGGAYLYQK